MTETQQVRVARRAVVQALTQRLRAENEDELARLKERLADVCREYNDAVRTHNQITRGSTEHV